MDLWMGVLVERQAKRNVHTRKSCAGKVTSCGRLTASSLLTVQDSDIHYLSMETASNLSHQA